MPPLLCASPCILDQSFPRNNQELQMVASTLGEVQLLVSENVVHLILPEALENFITGFDWNERNKQYPLLIEIHRLLSNWFLQPHSRLVHVNTTSVKNSFPHPLPEGTNDVGWARFWAEEIGKLLMIHDRTCAQGFFIGIACERAFCIGILSKWQNGQCRRCFPFIGPPQIQDLEDAYDWETLPPDLNQKTLSLADAKRNVKILGAIEVEEPHRDSHIKVKFPSSRPWILSKNIDPVPDNFIAELIDITGLPFNIIKTALVYGYIPKKNVLRLKEN